MYSKGKWGYLRSRRKHKESLFITTDAHKGENQFVGKVYGFRIHDEVANAERICQCVNGWDELQKQRDALLDALKYVIQHAKHKLQLDIILKIEQVIQEAEK